MIDMGEKFKNINDAFVYRGEAAHWHYYGEYFCNGDITAVEARMAADKISTEIAMLQENRAVYSRIAKIIETGGL